MYVTKGVDWPLVPKFHLNKSEAPFCETKRVPQEDCIFHFSFFHSLHERISDEESFKVPADELKLWESRHERFSDEDSFKVPADELKLGESRHKRLHWWASFGENLHFSFFHSLHEGICDEKSFKSPCRWAQIGRLEAWKVSLLDLSRRRILHHCLKRSLMGRSSKSLLVSRFTALSALFLRLLGAAFHPAGICWLWLVLFYHCIAKSGGL